VAGWESEEESGTCGVRGVGLATPSTVRLLNPYADENDELADTLAGMLSVNELVDAFDDVAVAGGSSVKERWEGTADEVELRCVDSALESSGERKRD